MDTQDRIARPNGRISVSRICHNIRDRGRKPEHRPSREEHLFSQANQIQYGWGTVAAQCIAKGNRNFKVNAIYIEYENVASPGDTVAVPTYGRDEGYDYYADLSLSANRDFIRAPLLVEPGISIAAGFEDYFTAGVDGNQATFYTQSQGSTGFHGKSFSAGANSKVFGVALVATPDFADPTQDVVVARTYFATGNQTLKLASSQIGITWDVSFE